MRLRTRFAANLVGLGWTSAVQLAFIPLYVHAMGVEAYGLFGFYVALLGILQLVELGLGPTISREMARAGVSNDVHRQRNALRTLELVYVLVAIVLAGVVALLAEPIADRWLSPDSLSRATVRDGIQLMGLLLLVQWPLALYQSALIGLQRQVLANLIRAGFATVGALVALTVLLKVEPTINAFLLSQAAIAAIQLICSAALTWTILVDPAHRAVFDLGWLREIAPFAIGISGIAAAGVVLTQLDKVVLSHSLQLGEFGIYSLAGVFGVGIGIIANAMFLVTFPRYTELVARGQLAPLMALYRSAAQLGAALSMAAAAVLAAFSVEILAAWTGDPGIAKAAAPILGLLAVGSALNAMWKNAYALQLAHGQTTMALRLSWVVAVLAVPSFVLASRDFGAVGAAAVWLVINGTLVAVGVPLTHRGLLVAARWTWLTDLAIPGAAAAMVVFAVRVLVPANSQPSAIFAAVAGASVLSVAAGLAAGPLARQWLAAQLRAITEGDLGQRS